MGAGTARTRLERRLPGLAVARSYQRSWLRGDLLAGVTVAAYLVPQVMAYAEVAGLPAVAGLWAVVAPLLIYAVLGSSRQLSIGPESTTALMTAAGVAALVGAAGPGRHAEVAALLAIAVGLICLVGFVAGVGFLAELLSRPVLVGYMAGIAVLMIVSQFGTLLRVPVSGDSVVDAVTDAARRLPEAHGPTLLLAVSVLAGLFTLQRWRPRWPGPLIAMLAAAAVVAVTGLGSTGIATVGAVPAGLPTPTLPQLRNLDLAALLPAALGIALVGYTDNVLTARAFATRRREWIDADQELLALGTANLATGLLQGFPVSSSGSRTVIGDAMGSRTQLHSLVALAVVLTTMIALSPVLAAFPTAALAAVVVYAAVRLIDVAEWVRIARFRRSELLIALATTASVTVLGVLQGIAVAVGLSLLDVLRRLASPHDGILGYVPGLAGMHDVDDYPQARQVPGLVVYRYDAPLFFANAEDFTRHALAAVDAATTDTEWLLLNVEAVAGVDLTAVDALDGLRERLAAQGVTLALARVKHELHDELRAAGFVDRVGEDHLFPTLPTAVQAYADAYEARHGTRPLDGGDPPR